MTREEEKYFEKLEEESRDNPLIKVQAAADYLVGTILKAVKTPQGINGNLFCKMMSVYTGIAVADTAKKLSEQNLITGDLKAKGMPRTRLDTEAGIFWIGDDINRLLFGHQYSVWHLVMTGVVMKKGQSAVPNMQEIIEHNARIIGDPSVTLWEGMYSPYSDFEDAKHSFYVLKEKLAPYKFVENEYYQAFSMALMKVILQVEAAFPAEMDCVKMAMELVTFDAHMDV